MEELMQGGKSRSTTLSQSKEIDKLHTPNHKIVHTNKKQNKDREAERIALAVREEVREELTTTSRPCS
jgi:predicted nucleic acid-binding protein